MGVRRWERPDEDNPALDNAVDIDSETTGRNRDVKLSGLGMSSRSATLEAPREVNAITLGQLPLELIRAEVSKMKGDWRAPGADAAMRPCHQDLRRGKNKLEPGSPGMPRVDGINTVVGGVEAPKENSNTTLPENRGEKPAVGREEDDPLYQWREHQDPWKTLGRKRIRSRGARKRRRDKGTTLPVKIKWETDSNWMSQKQKRNRERERRPPRYDKGGQVEQPETGVSTQKEVQQELENTGESKVRSSTVWNLIRNWISSETRSLLWSTCVWESRGIYGIYVKVQMSET